MSDNTHRFPASDDTTPLPPVRRWRPLRHRGPPAVRPATARLGRAERRPGPARRRPARSRRPPATPPARSAPRPRPAHRRPARRRPASSASAAACSGAAGYDALDDDPTSTAAPEPRGDRGLLAQPAAPRRTPRGRARPTAPAPRRPPTPSRRWPRAVLPSVVKINVTGAAGSGSGSGIILSEDGEILTNNHVVEVAADGGEMSVSFDDGTTADATIVGTDPVTDLAVIKAEGVTGLTPAAIGDSDALDVGEERRGDRLPVRPRGHRHQRHRQRAEPSGHHQRGQRVEHRAPTPSTPRSRPTRPSTPATPAARWSTWPARSSASTPRSAPTAPRSAARAARSASASPSRSPRCCRSSSSCATARPPPTPGSA